MARPRWLDDAIKRLLATRAADIAKDRSSRLAEQSLARANPTEFKRSVRERREARDPRNAADSGPTRGRE